VSAVASRSPVPATVIEPPRGLVPLRLHELWEYRDLFTFLVWRDVKVRWAQTRVGGAWLVLQPLAMLGVYTFAFSRVVNTHVDVPYPLFALAGLTAWVFSSRAIQTGSESLVSQLAVIKRTSCPRILFPLSAVTSGGIDFAIALGLYFVLGAIYGWTPTWHAVFVLPLFVLSFGLAFGFALLLAPAHARYRDVGRLLPFLIQLWFFLSPVAYALPASEGSKTRILESVNPMVGILGGFRWALLGAHPALQPLFVAIAVSAVAITAGIFRFNRAQQTIADEL
jgi:lipopolysaccharide transport system permease protein